MRRTVSCASLEKYQLLVRTRTHSWVADEPPELDGDGLGPNPFDLLLASLGACLMITVVHYAGQAKIPLERLFIDLEGDHGADKKYHAQATLRARGELSDSDMQRLERAAHRCPVHAILEQGADIQIHVQRA